MIRRFGAIVSGDGFAVRMSFFYAAFFLFSGIQMPYFPAWLAAKELDAREIGLVLALPMLSRITILPIASRLLDQRFDRRTVLIAAAATSALLYALMGMMIGFLAIVAAYATISVVSSPLLPLADSHALAGLNLRKLNYGSVRLWGSVAFIVANLLGGTLLVGLGADRVIFLLAAAMVSVVAAAMLLRPSGTKPSDCPPPVEGLWRSGLFVAVVTGASLIQSSHAVMYGFATLQWASKGLDGTTIGLLWAIGVAAEIALFATSGRLIARLGAIELILAGALGAIIRWTAMAFDPPTALLPVLQCLHAASFGATHAGAMYVLSQLSREGSSTTAQGDFAAVQGVTFAITMSFSGLLVERLGSYAYLAMTAVAAGGLVSVFAARRR